DSILASKLRSLHRTQCGSARGFMDSEHKSYRNDWQTAKGQESARAHIMRHLLSEHDLVADEAWDVALLLADHRWLDEGDAELLAESLRDDLNNLSLTTLVLQGPDAQQPSNDSTLNRRQVWALTHWVFADAIPAAFRFAGFAEEAQRFATAAPSFPLENSAYVLEERLSAVAGWQQLETSATDEAANDLDAYFGGLMGASRRAQKEALRLAEDVLGAAGLAGRRSPLVTVYGATAEDEVHEGGEGKWRLLRGRRLWIGMYLTMTPDERDTWVALWELGGLLLVRALSASVRRVAEELEVDLAGSASLNAEFRERCRTLQEAYALSMRDFVDAAVSLR
uniref:hypothetical protein n=1 Tax=Ruania rhizosphaerae TaxID=1840413 RepID=UPI001F451344